MTHRLALGAVWTLSLGVVLGLVLLAWGLSTGAPEGEASAGAGGASAVDGTAPGNGGRTDPRIGAVGWNLVDRLSAHNVLVMTVETERLDDARQIAQRLVERREHTYAEIMIYFHRPGESEAPPARRVQWTPNDGYVAVNLEEFYTRPPTPPA